MFHGAIIPRVVTAGTVTRRAVEPTWLTASNAYVRYVFILLHTGWCKNWIVDHCESADARCFTR